MITSPLGGGLSFRLVVGTGHIHGCPAFVSIVRTDPNGPRATVKETTRLIQKGNEFELKTVNVLLTQGYSTHHRMNPTINAKYRKVDWYFAEYRGIILDTIHHMTPVQLNPYLQKWDEKWHQDGGKDINNPKIPIKFVRSVGTLVYKAKFAS
jgi:hypothetical protein